MHWFTARCGIQGARFVLFVTSWFNLLSSLRLSLRPCVSAVAFSVNERTPAYFTTAAHTISMVRLSPSSVPIGPSLNWLRAAGFQWSGRVLATGTWNSAAVP